MNKEPKEPKFPENITFKKTLVTGDYGEIAKITGHSIRHIQEVFNGRSRMNDKIKAAYVALLTKREKLNLEVVKKARKDVSLKVKRNKPKAQPLSHDAGQCGSCQAGPECSCDNSCPYF